MILCGRRRETAARAPDPVEVLEHHGDIIVRGRYEGTYDKTNLPAVLIMSNYFAVRDGRIVSLAIIFNRPSPYDDHAHSVGR